MNRTTRDLNGKLDFSAFLACFDLIFNKFYMFRLRFQHSLKGALSLTDNFSGIPSLPRHKKAGEEIAMLASFPELNPNPVIEADFDGNIGYANPAAKKMFPDLENLGSHHPFLSDWKSVVKTLEDEKGTFSREIKANIGIINYFMLLQKVSVYVFTQKTLIILKERKRHYEKASNAGLPP